MGLTDKIKGKTEEAAGEIKGKTKETAGEVKGKTKEACRGNKRQN